MCWSDITIGHVLEEIRKLKGHTDECFFPSLKVFVAERGDSSSKSQQQPRHSVVESFHTAKCIQSQVK